MFLRGERGGEFLLVLMGRTQGELEDLLAVLRDDSGGYTAGGALEVRILQGFPWEAGVVEEVLQPIE